MPNSANANDDKFGESLSHYQESELMGVVSGVASPEVWKAYFLHDNMVSSSRCRQLESPADEASSTDLGFLSASPEALLLSCAQN